MGVLDIVIVCCFLPALFLGIRNGLVRQLVSLAVIYFGITLSLRFSSRVSRWVLDYVEISDFWIQSVSFILIFFAVAFILSCLGRIVEKIIKISLLAWLNRMLGIVAAFCTFLLLLSVLVYFIDSLNNLLNFIPKEKIEESRLYPALRDLSQQIFPYFRELFHQAKS